MHIVLDLGKVWDGLGRVNMIENLKEAIYSLNDTVLCALVPQLQPEVVKLFSRDIAILIFIHHFVELECIVIAPA